MQIKEFLKTIEGLAPNTRSAYEATLWQLHQASKGDEPTPEEIKGFLSRYGTSSIHRHKAAIKNYLEFMGITWPFTRRQFGVSRRRIPRYVNPDLVPSIASAGDEDDYMFVMTLFTLGCRISELMGITREDIREAGVEVTTKGGYYRLKPMARDFASKLRKYAASKDDKPFSGKYSFYYARLKELGKAAGVEKISPHMLRHARAVDLRRKGMSLDLLQQFLGHASITTTAVYLEIEPGELGTELERVEGGENAQPEL